MKTKIILGVHILSGSMGQAVEFLDQALAEAGTVCTTYLNAHLAMQAQADARLFGNLKSFVVLNDGIGVDVASWLKYGTMFDENLNGTDFTPFYLEKTSYQFRIFLLGARPHIVEKVAEIFAKQYPQHVIAGFFNGYSPRDDELVNRIRELKTDLILVAMGNPLQEKWIADNFDKTGAVMAMGVGGLFDFVSGRLPRAPIWMRRLRCEWLYRFWCEPRRLWRRYTIVNAQFLLAAFRDALQYRMR